MGIEYPTYNGKALDFASIEIDLGGTIYTAFSDISYKQPIEEGVMYGTYAEPLARTRGRLKIGDGSLEWSNAEECQLFIDQLGDGYLETEFDITHVLAYPGTAVLTRVLYSARLLDVTDANKGGTDALGNTTPFSFLRMTRNGKSALIYQLK